MAGLELALGEFFAWYIFLIVIICLITIIICYILLQRTAQRSSNYLKTMGNVTTELQKREMRMTRTIFLLILSHGICNIPLRFYEGLHFTEAIPETYFSQDIFYVLMIVYQTQFALNFFIYAGSNEQYRKTYLDYWKYLTYRDGRDNKIINYRKTVGFDIHLLLPRVRHLLRHLQGNTKNMYQVNN